MDSEHFQRRGKDPRLKFRVIYPDVDLSKVDVSKVDVSRNVRGFFHEEISAPQKILQPDFRRREAAQDNVLSTPKKPAWKHQKNRIC